MSEATPAPPTKPRGARRRVYVAVVLVAYVGGYLALRSAGRLEIFQTYRGGWSVADSNAPIDEVESGGIEGQGTWPVTMCAPCIAAEEWWLNR